MRAGGKWRHEADARDARGGPLVNARGEVVGINTLFLKRAPGISYARPIAFASRIVDVARAPRRVA